jgi:GntR family transcriptional regulator
LSELYQVDSNLGIPIYRQLVDVIRSNVKNGKMPPGMQLPTVRDLADELGVARGTIKRSYDELEQLGIVEKIQGRGTFVRYQPTSSDSRKDRAMAAIDSLLDQLEGMDFSMAEINIFLNLRLRDRAAKQQNLKIAVVECNPEILSQLVVQLRGIRQVDWYSYLLDDIVAYPYKISEDMDLVVTTAEHAEDIGSRISQKNKIAKIALRLRPDCVAKIVKLPAGERLGIVCRSQRFGHLLYDLSSTYTEQVSLSEPVLADQDIDWNAYFFDKTAILVPENYEKYCSGEVTRWLKRFEGAGHLIQCAYQVDEGSLMYLTEKIDRLREKQKI